MVDPDTWPRFPFEAAWAISLLYLGYTAIVDIHRAMSTSHEGDVPERFAVPSYLVRAVPVLLCFSFLSAFAESAVASFSELSITTRFFLSLFVPAFVGSLLWALSGQWIMSAIVYGTSSGFAFRGSSRFFPLIATLLLINLVIPLTDLFFIYSHPQSDAVRIGQVVVRQGCLIICQIVSVAVVVRVFLTAHSGTSHQISRRWL
ncbi:hypothetical protein [Pararhizobium antarcticum]|uniref:hypothetical protein n=1 Tax=Pararhizobium antarcticum TaxID=1798805 RepID=UPI001114A6CA|nr:hypothetical protein [Pararhizobium antarcticum]